MLDNNELVNMLRAVIQEELKPIESRLDTMERGLVDVRRELQQVNKRLDTLETGQIELKISQTELKMNQAELKMSQAELKIGQTELKKGQAAIEAAVNDLRAINRRTHREIFKQLEAIWNDIKLIEKRLEVQEKTAIQ